MTMAFFGKLKNLHSGPPAPPRRTDNNLGWPDDEFEDDEDGDTYEAPPCERPPVKVPQRQVEENVYLERTSSPVVPQRQAAPPPRPGKPLKPQPRADDFSHDPTTKKPPEIDRNEKPGRKKMMPPPPTRSSPAPAPAAVPESNTDEDVYLDPHDEQDDNDDLYLEPTAACPPSPRGQIWMPPPPKTALVPTSMMKPPVPRAKSNSSLLSVNEIRSAPPVEARRVPLPPSAKPPPPAPGAKPPLHAGLKEPKPIPPNPPLADTKPVAAMRTRKQSVIEDREWFAGDCNRKTAEELLLRVDKDGAFLIRHSSTQSVRQPFSLAVLYQEKVYNIPIRFLEETRRYALGKEGKKNEETFPSLDEMISHHKNNQLLLIDSKSHAKHTAYLTHPARP